MSACKFVSHTMLFLNEGRYLERHSSASSMIKLSGLLSAMNLHIAFGSIVKKKEFETFDVYYQLSLEHRKCLRELYNQFLGGKVKYEDFFDIVESFGIVPEVKNGVNVDFASDEIVIDDTNVMKPVPSCEYVCRTCFMPWKVMSVIATPVSWIVLVVNDRGNEIIMFLKRTISIDLSDCIRLENVALIPESMSSNGYVPSLENNIKSCISCAEHCNHAPLWVFKIARLTIKAFMNLPYETIYIKIDEPSSQNTRTVVNRYRATQVSNFDPEKNWFSRNFTRCINEWAISKGKQPIIHISSNTKNYALKKYICLGSMMRDFMCSINILSKE